MHKILAAIIFFLFSVQVHAQENLDILQNWRIYPDAKNALGRT
jgi:hypothetical protein